MRVSVCLATYNGSRFIVEQIESILAQMQDDDELIVVDDCSEDQTLEIIENYKDSRIRIYKNTINIGVNGTFERAISLANGDYIFLSDQDDIWINGRLDYMLNAFSNAHIDVVATNYNLIDTFGNKIEGSLAPFLKKDDDRTVIKNIIKIFAGKMNYYGCAMAFRSNLRNTLIPFPSRLECHDIWIGLVGNVRNRICHLPEPTLLHRVHGTNASIVKRTLIPKLRSRFYLFNHLAVALARS